MADRRTLAVYDAKVADYAKLAGTDKPDRHLRAFVAHLPAGARVLDLGCGPGTTSALLRAAGFDPDPVDAAKGMVAHAQKTHGLPARLLTFDQVKMVADYDGIWANFSLLHALRSELPRHLDAIATALKPGGIFHIGMKTGTGEKRDGLGRKYTYVTEAELRDLLAAAGFALLDVDTGAGQGLDGTVAPWVIMLARKEDHG